MGGVKFDVSLCQIGGPRVCQTEAGARLGARGPVQGVPLSEMGYQTWMGYQTVMGYQE